MISAKVSRSMKPIFQIMLLMLIVTMACQSPGSKKSVTASDKVLQAATKKDTLAIDILLDPGEKMLEASKMYNDRLRDNYPEGFELDATHRPHVTVIQAFVKASDLDNIEHDLKRIMSERNLTGSELTANGLYYIPYEDKGLAGITIDKEELIEFHYKVVEMMNRYTVANGTGNAFVARPDGEDIMQATVDYVNNFVPNSSGENYNPHVTIGTAYQDFVESLLSEPFDNFLFHVKSVSIYQLGELGTAQKKLATIKI